MLACCGMAISSRALRRRTRASRERYRLQSWILSVYFSIFSCTKPASRIAVADCLTLPRRDHIASMSLVCSLVSQPQSAKSLANTLTAVRLSGSIRSTAAAIRTESSKSLSSGCPMIVISFGTADRAFLPRSLSPCVPSCDLECAPDRPPSRQT